MLAWTFLALLLIVIPAFAGVWLSCGVIADALARKLFPAEDSTRPD